MYKEVYVIISNYFEEIARATFEALVGISLVTMKTGNIELHKKYFTKILETYTTNN